MTNTLICIYTCSRDIECDILIRESDWYLKNQSPVLFVTCDPSITHDYIFQHKSNKLIIKTEESYTNLSTKTLKMIQAVVAEMQFDYMVKVDSTLINYRMKTESWHKWSAFEEFIASDKSLQVYGGIKYWKHLKLRRTLAWHRDRGISVNKDDIVNIFRGNIPYDKHKNKWYKVKFPGWWTGKCYVINREFAEYISLNGDSINSMFIKANLGAPEDLYIGNMYSRYNKLRPYYE